MKGEIIREVQVPTGTLKLDGTLHIPPEAAGVVIFAHGSGSSRHSPRNKFVAEVIRNAGVGTLLFDLLSADEESVDVYTRQFRFDIAMLAGRLTDAANWLRSQEETAGLNIDYFGSSTGGGAALVAAAELEGEIGAVVSRGGRPDLAGDALPHVTAPVLLIVGGLDSVVIELNRLAYDRLKCEREIAIVQGATHLFEEPGKLEEVARLAADWFRRHLGTPAVRQTAVG
ncbi:MAG: dienelactone hydrolase family protein [Pyrinomonadaceae bacterium]|nr:dienelactone hydrolase family protein [Pyrinomonadaceae bacterium]